MPAFEKTILVHAPLENVFRYVANPANLPEFWSNVVEVSEIQRLPSGGRKFEWVYKMINVRLEGASETIDFSPYQRFTTVLKGGFRGVASWTFEKDGDNTVVSVHLDYHIPPPLLKKHTAEAITEQNERDLSEALKHLKANLEPQILTTS